MLTRFRNMRAALRKPAEQRTLSEKLIISGTLTGVDQAANILFRLGSTLIVTRLLAPEIFGLFAIVSVFQVIVIMITDFGIRSLIIVSDESKDPDFLRTCWTIQVIRGFAIYAIILLLVLGLYVLQVQNVVTGDIVYADPVLPLALAVSALQLVLRGFQSVNHHVYAKEMRFRRATMMSVTRSAAAPLFTIMIALYHPSVWALVISGILADALQIFLTFRLFTGPKMWFCLKKDYVRELLRRGRWIMSSSTLTAATSQADQMLLGAFLPPSLLGTYFLAKQIVSLPQSIIFRMNRAVGLQFFQQIIDLPRKSDMIRKYYRFRVPIDFFACAAAGSLLTGALAVIDLIYDPRYLPAGPILQLLAIGLPLIGMNLITGAFGVRKRFHIMTILGAIRAVTIWGGLLFALIVLESPEAAFVLIALHQVPGSIFLLALARREGWVSIWREFRLLPAIGLGALAGWLFSLLYFGSQAA